MNRQEFDSKYCYYGFWILVGGVVALVFQYLLPFVAGIVGGAILSVLTYPLYERIRKRLSPTMSSLATVLTTIVVVAIPLTLVGVMVSLQMKSVVTAIEQNKEGGQDTISVDLVVSRIDDALIPVAERAGSDFKFKEWFDENRQDLTENATRSLTRLGISTGIGVFMIIISFLCMFFMLRDGERLLEPYVDLMPMAKSQSLELLERVGKTVHAVFMGVVLVAFIQGTIATIFYAIAGVNAWLMWGAATAVCAAIPVLGAPVIYVPLSLLLMAQGRFVPGVILLIACLAIVSNVDNILRPKYIGERVGLHYMVVFFSLLGGILAYGPVGIMLGPCLATALLCLVDFIRAMRKSGEPEPISG